MTNSLPTPLDAVSGGLIVSVQADDRSPVRDVDVITALGLSALIGGARALRLNGPEDVKRMRGLTTLPIIGLHKLHNGTRNIITPTVELALGLAVAGADVIAVDATIEALGDGFDFLGEISDATGRPVMADVSTFDEGWRAWRHGAAVVGTTLSGYTPDTATRAEDAPDIALVAELADAGVPVIAEGRYRTPDHVAAAFAAGARAVVVGGAITDPIAITARLVAVTPSVSKQRA